MHEFQKQCKSLRGKTYKVPAAVSVKSLWFSHRKEPLFSLRKLRRIDKHGKNLGFQHLILFFFLSGGKKERLLSCIVCYITNVGEEMLLTSGIPVLKKKCFLFPVGYGVLFGVFFKERHYRGWRGVLFFVKVNFCLWEGYPHWNRFWPLQQ